MEVIDIILIALLVLFTLAGFYFGFVHTAGSLIGLVIGIYSASYFTGLVSTEFIILSGPKTKVIVFIVTMFIVTRVISWLVDLLDETLNILSIIPFLKTINKLLGGVFGFIEGGVLLVAIAFVSEIVLTEGVLRESILSSQIINWLSWTTDLIVWIFPQA